MEVECGHLGIGHFDALGIAFGIEGRPNLQAFSVGRSLDQTDDDLVADEWFGRRPSGTSVPLAAIHGAGVSCRWPLRLRENRC